MKFLLENTEVISIGRTTVLKNPSDRDYTQLEREQRRLHPNVAVWEPLLRRTYGEKGNTYVWPAFDATHRDIEWELYKRYGERTNQGKNWDLFDHYYLESLNEDVELSNEYDNEKNKLTKEQIEFFKYSKIRDSQDRLLVCYHGTSNEFDIFDNIKSLKGILEGGLYFTSNKQTGSAYGEKGRVLSVYLNITGYLDLTNYSKDYIQDVIEHIPEDQLNLGDKYNVDRTSGFYFVNLANMVYKHNRSYKTACDVIEGWGYDGVKQDDETYIAFHSNQIKSISNQSPTDNDNINESISKPNWTQKDVLNFIYRNYKHLINKETNRSFILPNGDFLSTGDDYRTHVNIEWDIQNYLVKYFNIENFKHSKLDHPVTDMCGFIRVNNVNEDYVCLSSVKPTIEQYNSLLNWLDEFNEMKDYIKIISYNGNIFVKYNLEEVTPDYVLNRIKRFYASDNLYEAKETTINNFEIYTCGYVLSDGHILTLNEYHGEESSLSDKGYPEFSNTHPEEDTCIRIYDEPNEAQYDTIEKIIDTYLDSVGYCKIEIWKKHDYRYYFYKVFSLYDDACRDIGWKENVENWTGYKLVNIIKNFFKRSVNNINEDLDKSDITQDQWRTVSKLNMVNDIRHYGDLIHLELTDRWGNAIYIGNVTYDELVERVGKTIADIIKHKLDTHEPQVYYYEIYNILNKYRKFFKQDDNKLYLQAKEHFGTTSNPKLAGYLNVDGSLLDFSWGQDYRGTDHREIDQIMDDYSGSEAMYHYMNLGNIRVKPETPGIEIIVEPTKEQYGMIDRLATYFVYRENNFYLDISDKDGYNVGSVEYNKGDIHNIVYDIQNYFKTGKLPVNIED